MCGEKRWEFSKLTIDKVWEICYTNLASTRECKPQRRVHINRARSVSELVSLRSFGKSIPKRSALFVLVSLERAKRDSRGTRAPLWREGRGEVDLSAVGVQRARLDLWGVWYLAKRSETEAVRFRRIAETVKPPPHKSSRAQRRGRDGSRNEARVSAGGEEETATDEAKTAEQGTNNTAGISTLPRGAEAGRGSLSWVGANNERARELRSVAELLFLFFSLQSEASFNGGCTTTPPLSDL